MVKDGTGRVSLLAIFLPFVRLGFTGFGGPAMVPYIKELAVGRKAWLDEQSFRAGVVLCQTIPGATAMQAAAYVGLRVRGILGGLAAYIGFGLPAFLLMLVLTAIYLHTRELPVTTSLFAGLRVVVVAIVANATVDFGLLNQARARRGDRRAGGGRSPAAENEPDRGDRDLRRPGLPAQREGSGAGRAPTPGGLSVRCCWWRSAP